MAALLGALEGKPIVFVFFFAPSGMLQLATYATAACLCLAHDNCLGFYGFRRPVFHSKLAFELSYNPAFMCHQNIVLRLLGVCSRQQQLASSSWHYMAMRNRTRSPAHCIAPLAGYYYTPGQVQRGCWLAAGTSHKSCHLV